MRRAVAAVSASALLACGTASAASSGVRSESASAEAASPARLMVSASEWSLLLSRVSIKPGSARIQLYNAGEDAHDLRVRPVGKLTELRLKLRPGRYRLWCSLPEHAQRGMRATLTVRP
jgi:hypothetical protein